MNIKTRDYFVFLSFFLGVLLVHWPARNAGFVSDFLGWQELYDKGPWWAFIYSFGYGGHQQVLQLINYSMYKAFGTYGLPWYLLFCLFHTLNGWLLYFLLLKISELWGTPYGRFTAIFGALFFLFSPYHPEVTVWRVCLHYMISGICTLAALLCTMQYLTHGRTRVLWYAHGWMLLNLFTLELALAIPLLTHGLLIGWQFSATRAKSADGEDGEEAHRTIRWLQVFKFMTLPQIGLYIFFFVFNKITLGQWVGHYGEKRMLQFDGVKMLSAPLKYVVKPVFFARHWSHGDKTQLFNWMSTDFIVLMGYLLLTAMALSVVFLRNGLPGRIKVSVVLLWLGVLAAFPVSNLHFEWLLYNENDRYGYMTALFVLPIVAILFSWLARWWKYFAACLYLILSIHLMSLSIGDWAEMERIYRKLLREFVWFDKKELYVLSLADNYEGIWMFRNYVKGSALADAFKITEHRDLSIDTHEIAFYNMNSSEDGITASIPDPKDGLIRVQFDQWGNWWWLYGLGAKDYETDEYSVEFKDNWYNLRLKNPSPDAVFIYQSGDGWKTLSR